MTTWQHQPKAKPSVDPKEIFLMAEAFSNAARTIGDHHNHRDGMTNPSQTIHTQAPLDLIPAAVCAAFSLELYFKCLLRLENVNPRKMHDLDALFAKLSTESRRFIRQCYTHEVGPTVETMKRTAARLKAEGINHTPPAIEDLDHVLSASAKVFEKFRYAFEGLSREEWIAGNVTTCVRRRIIALHPEWEPQPAPARPGTQAPS